MVHLIYGSTSRCQAELSRNARTSGLGRCICPEFKTPKTCTHQHIVCLVAPLNPFTLLVFHTLFVSAHVPSALRRYYLLVAQQTSCIGGGGLQPKKKPNATANFKFGTGFFGLFLFFSVFPFCPILTGLTGFVKWFLLVMIAFIRHLQGFIGIKCVIRQFLASLDLIVDMIFE